jgi:UDP-glucose:(heptosyl)LPS alpha-1,3-glucosyltransferase
LKIALIVEWLDAWRGGAETSSQQFAHHLRDAGVHVTVFTRSRLSPAPGLEVYTISGASMSRMRRSMTFARRAARAARRQAFDIVHAISPCPGADIYQPRGGTVAETVERNLALQAAPALRSLKRVANVLNFKQRYLLRMERAMMREPDGPIVVAISDYVVRQLEHHYQLPASRVVKIYNGVDPDPASDAQRAVHRSRVRREFGIDEQELLVLVVAHNFRLKGVARWMEALSILQQRGGGVRSLVVGRGATAAWHRRADRLGIGQSLTFVGPSDRVPMLRHAADVIVHPTYYDPCSRVVLEGMAAGLPCITTRWDGSAEMIDEGVSGFVLDDPSDVRGLADRVDRLRPADTRLAMGQAARGVAERISMARHAAEMIALYERVVREKAGEPQAGRAS